MDALGDELAPEGVHHQERGHTAGVAVVVPELALGEGRCGLGLDGDDLRLGPSGELLPHHREGESGEVGSPSDAGDHVIGDDLGLLHLLEGLQTDDGLVEHDMVQNASEGVAGVLVVGGELACLGYGDAQGSCGAGVLLVHPPAELGELGRGGVDLGSVHVHQGLPERLLVVAATDHEDGGLDVEEVRHHGEGSPPLPRTGLGGECVDTGLGVVVGLSQSGVALVASEGAHVLPLEVDLGRGLEVPLETVRPLEGCGPVQVDQIVPDLLGDVDVPLRGALLLDDRLAEDGFEVLGLRRLLGDRVERRLDGIGEIGREVVPALRYLLGVECDACIFRYCHK